MSNRVLLVTGGAGFIGSNFVRYWLDRCPNDRVVVLDALTYAGNPANFAMLSDNPRFRFYAGRIEDSTVVNGIFRVEGITHVVNFAAESHNDRSMLEPTRLIATNVAGVSVLMEAAKAFGSERVVHVSTDEVYGEIQTGKFKETDPLLPRQPYSAGKAGGEMQVRAHNIAYGVPTVVTRGCNTFGPYQFPEKLIPFFITRAFQDKKVPVYGDGQQIRDWIHVLDHCEGIAIALENGTIGEAYNIGGIVERPNIDITKIILQTLGKGEELIKYIPDPRGKGHDQRYAVDSTKIAAIGWAPKHDFDTHLIETIHWYVNNRAWWQPILDSSDYQTFVNRYYGPGLGSDL